MSWKRQVQAYDDDALAQLGSTGLVRRARKQLESGKVALHSDENGKGTFIVDTQQVTLFNAPLEQSRCDCNASGVCVHILAAVLHTRESVGISTAPTSEEPHSLTAREELELYSPEAVMKWAGKPGTRLAARLLATLATNERHIEEKSGSLEIVLDNEVRCRYILGAGLDGILCDAPESRRKGVIAACLLHWQQQQGRSWHWPDDALPNDTGSALSDEESALVREVQEQLKRMLDAGLMHLPEEHVNALRTMSWSARGDNLPRLSALLLRFAGEVAAFHDRLAGTEPQRLLDQLVSLWVLCERLLNASPQDMQALRGQFRRDYSEACVGPLWYCGAYRYQSRSGAQGVSMILWDLESQKPLRLNMGRTGEGGGSMNPQSLWQAVLPWTKGRSPENLNGKVLRLEGARISGDGRLSQSQETVLLSVEASNDFSVAIDKLGIAQWDLLSELLDVGLESEEAVMPPLIIRPREVKPFRVSEHDQRWIGWAKDSNKKWLRLSAPVDDIHNERIEAINKLITQAPSELWGMVLEPSRDQEAMSLVPTAVAMKRGNELRCFNPDLEYVTTGKKRFSIWLRQALGSEVKPTPPEEHDPEFISIIRLLKHSRQHLLGAAEIGLDCSYLRIEQLTHLVQALHDAKALTLSKTLEQAASHPTYESLVKACYVFGIAWRQFLLMEQIQAE